MEPFKNFINLESAQRIAQAIERSYPDFDRKKFLKNIEKSLAPLELKERVTFVAHRLKECLPDNQKKSLPILKKASKKNEQDSIGLSGFNLWPLTEYVALFGVDEFDLSMDVLKEMTKAFTSEFAIRTFFLTDLKRTLEYFKKWVHDDNDHVRRLVSEGSRPLLPWGQKLPAFVKDPHLTWEFLEILKHDDSAYVRKSVANHLNDHSKNHPDQVVKKLLQWKKLHKDDKHVDWIIRHASRTLIKKGHADAFILHGVRPGKIKVLTHKLLTKKIKLGESLKSEIELQNLEKKTLTLIIDHEVHLLRARGLHKIKCFKGKKIDILPSEKVKIQLSLPIKSVTTRSYYEGEQFWNIKVNGLSEKKIPFQLSVK